MFFFKLSNEIGFKIYIHDLGEEYFLHYDYWPTMPMQYDVKDKDRIIDIMVQKDVKETDENCEVGEDYSYFGKSKPKSE